MKHSEGWSRLVMFAAAGGLALGCVPKGGGKGADQLPPPQEAAKPCGPEGLIDDMEDNNNQVMLQGGRGGYWYTFVDNAGSEITPQAGEKGGGPFTMSEGGANGSKYAARFYGKIGDGSVVYAGAGANFVDPKDQYDASAYGGFSFYARKGPGVGSVRLKVPDMNTDPQGEVCKECYNDFGVDLEFTGSWKKYVVPFSVMKQMSGWGDPIVPNITRSKLYGIQWQVNQKGQPYDIWIDDLAFTGCGS